MSEILVGSISETAEDVGLSEFFIGVFIVAIVGIAADQWVAVLVAAKDKMDLAVNISVGSSAQIALFVAPLLVLLSFVFGDHPMALVFNGYELGAMLFAVLIANFLIQDGQSNWFEGTQLLAVYGVLGLVFYYA
jgi:Ca2+:H+ antiporter